MEKKRYTPKGQCYIERDGTSQLVYHWMSTRKVPDVVDEEFRVRQVKNLRVGSVAVLPEIPEANPHMTITAFSIALAHQIYQTYAKSPNNLTSDLQQAQNDLVQSGGMLQIRREKDAKPDMSSIAKEHAKIYQLG